MRLVLEDDGWFVVRTAASLGPCDLIAFKHGHAPRFIQVKATKGGRFDGFPPKERNELWDIAVKSGACAELAHWPPRGKLSWYRAALMAVGSAAVLEWLAV